MDKYAIDPQLKKRKNFSFPFNRLVFPFANLFLSLLPKRFDKKIVKVDYLKVSNAKIHIVTPLDLVDKESPCLFYIHGGGIDYGLSPKHPFPYARNQCFLNL